MVWVKSDKRGDLSLMKFWNYMILRKQSYPDSNLPLLADKILKRWYRLKISSATNGISESEILLHECYI